MESCSPSNGGSHSRPCAGDRPDDDYYESLKIKKHYDFIDVNKDGCTLLASSSLTSRYWSGDVWLFNNAADVPHVHKCVAHHALDDAGVSCVKFVDGLAIRAVLCQDNGTVEVIGWEPESCSNGGSPATNGHSAANSGAGDKLDADDKRDAPGRPAQFVSHGRVTEHEGCVLCVDVAADGGDGGAPSRAVTGGVDGCVKVWDLETLVSEQTYRDAHTHWVTGVAMRPDQPHQLVSCSLDGSVLLWDTRTQHAPASYLVRPAGGQRAQCVSWSPLDVTSIAVGWQSGAVSVHNSLTAGDTKSAAPAVSSVVAQRRVHAVSWHPRRAWLAVCADQCTVTVLDVQKNNTSVKHQDDTHKDMVRGLCWLPGTDCLMSCGWDSQIVRRTIAA